MNHTNDEKRFCSKCNWNDCDYGCTCPSNEEVYQCPMYMHYHPDEVKEFEKSMEEWAKQKTESEGIHCNHTDLEIAKSFIKDVEAVKDLLPQGRK